MKRLLALLIGCTCLKAKSIVTDDLIDKFAMIESNYDYNAVGDKGKANGAWQMHEDAFNDGLKYLSFKSKSEAFSNLDYKEFINSPMFSRIAAKGYMLMLEDRLINYGIKPTPIVLYMAWNMGFSGARIHRFNFKDTDLHSKRQSILARANYILSR